MDAVSKKTFPTYNPSTLEKLADVAEADKVRILNKISTLTYPIF